MTVPSTAATRNGLLGINALPGYNMLIRNGSRRRRPSAGSIVVGPKEGTRRWHRPESFKRRD